MFNAEAAAKAANATVINAVAGFNKSQAEVTKLLQEAREKSAQNDLLETDVFYKKRAQYDAYRAAHRPKPSSPSEHIFRAQKAAPERLAAHQLQKDGLRWPTLLSAPVYEAARCAIDELWECRTPEDSGAGSQNCVRIVAALEALKAALLENISRYRPSDYLTARKFLDGVAVEAQDPVKSVSDMVDKVAGR
jgi:hypothetical protein